ncbi:MAG: TIM barrel protein [Clostridia bacterium]|nr:TIM barrel protein [Clostridia bacterium]
MSFQTGLVSISFRPYSVNQILAACSAAKLSLIEWGSDVHVPAGNAKIADEVAKKTADAGLKCITYGSYFRIGHTPLSELDAYLDSALRLGAKNIRMWCGTSPSAAAPPELRAKIVQEGRAAAERAAALGLNITLECHSGTLTDDCGSAMQYLAEVDHPAMRMYWQPSQFHTADYNLATAQAYARYTECLHVFHWDTSRRYPLADGTDIWAKYLDIFRAENRDIGLLLEFMHDDRLETLDPTAKTLHSWL